MNVATAADSPLAQYLAELENDGSVPGTVSSVLGDVPPTRLAPPKSDASDRSSTGAALSRSLFTNAQTHVLNTLLTKLSTSNAFPNFRECVLEAAGTGEQALTTTRFWIPQAVGQRNGAVFAIMSGVAIASSRANPNEPSDPFAFALTWRPLCTTVAVAAVLLIGVEVFYQLLVAWYTFSALRLVKAMRIYVSASTELKQTFLLALDVVKRSELTARGYRLGRILPPIGRLEEASSARDPHFEVQCRLLRLRLRDINDEIERVGRAVASRTLSSIENAGNAMHQSKVKKKSEPGDQTTPSLLITALAKRHTLSVFLLENALRETFVADFARMLRDLAGRDHQCFLPTMSSQSQTFRVLTVTMRTWTSDLQRQNARQRRRFQPYDDRDVPRNQQGKEIPSNVEAVRRALVEFQASCETLKSLAHTGELDIEEAFSSAPLRSSKVGELDESKESPWQNRLKRSQNHIGKLMDQLARDWDRLESAIQAADSNSSSSSTTNDTATQASEESGILDPLERQSESELVRQEQQDAERDYLLVFTATSTGEKDFDLQSLLRQHQQPSTSADAIPVPSFMGELQNVLERRQALLPSAPTLEKHIGEYGPTFVDRFGPSNVTAPAPPRTVDLQQLLQSRFTAQLTEECFGSDESDEENTH